MLRTGELTRCRLLRFIVAVSALAVMPGCNASGGSDGRTPPPAITIKSISAYYPANPALGLPYAIAGQPGFTLLLNGTGFTSTSVVYWNDNQLPTAFGDSTDLDASVSSALIAAPGVVKIVVNDPGTGAVSNSLTLPIASPATATAGVVALISAAPDGSPANGDSLVAPSISATGRYVAFQSSATNLVAGSASGYQEIYERDTCVGAPSGCTPTTIRITATYDGSFVNGHSRDSSISADGRYVAFDSSATNILPNSDACAPSAGYSCVFLRDTCVGASAGCTPTTYPISVDTGGNIVQAGYAAITPDGRFVSFGSGANNIVQGDTNGVADVFLRDTCVDAPLGCSPSTILISLSTSGAQGNAISSPLAVSSTARYVAFQSWATNLVPDGGAAPGMYLRDDCMGASGPCVPATSRVDLTAGGAQPNGNVTNNIAPAITADGRLVAFGSTASNLVATNVNGNCASTGGCSDVYVRDLCNGALANCTPTTSLASLANDGSVGNCSSPSEQLAISADGRFVAFDSIATNLTPDDSFPACAREDVFVRDTCLGITSGCTPSTVRVSVANKPNPGISGNENSGYPAMSADGHYVVFISSATNLLPGVTTNGHAMVWLAKTGY